MVVRGDDAGTCICAICSTREKAEKIAPYFYDDWEFVDIEEWPIDILPPEGKQRFHLKAKRDGEIEKLSMAFCDDIKDFSNQTIELTNENGWVFLVWAKDKKEAIQIVEKNLKNK